MTVTAKTGPLSKNSDLGQIKMQQVHAPRELFSKILVQ